MNRDRLTSPEGPPRGRAPRTRETAALAAHERTVSSASLFAGGKEVVIEHEGELYRLRHTSKGKLILTK